MGNCVTDTYCNKCHEPIIDEDSTNRKPCPKCGALSRTYALTASITVAVSVSAKTGLISYPQSMLDTARNYITEGKDGLLSMAVILCHVACEIASERALSAAFAGRGISDLQDVVCRRFRSTRVANEEVHKLYTSLSGDDIAQAPFWAEYIESTKLRDGIAHEGKSASRNDAERAHKAATGLVSHLDQ